MKRYKTIILLGKLRPPEIDELLNRQDEKGWQLISHSVEGKDTVNHSSIHYFIFFHP